MPGAGEMSVALSGAVGEAAPVALLVDDVVGGGPPPCGDVDGGGGLVVQTGGVGVELLDVDPGGSVVLDGGGGVVLAVPPSILRKLSTRRRGSDDARDLRDGDRAHQFLRLNAQNVRRAWVEPGPLCDLHALLRACVARCDVLRAVERE